MGRTLLSKWQDSLPPPGAFDIGEFVGTLQEVVPDSVMLRLLYQPTSRDPDRPSVLVVMGKYPSSFYSKFLLCPGCSCVAPLFPELFLSKSNCVTSSAGDNAMKCRFWTPPCKFPRPAGAQVIFAWLGAKITVVLEFIAWLKPYSFVLQVDLASSSLWTAFY